MTFLVDSVVCDLVVLSAGGCLRRDYIQDTVRKVCEARKKEQIAGVSTKEILSSDLVFVNPSLVYKDGTTRPLRDIAPRDYFPVFLVSGETDLKSGDIAELFAAHPGDFEVTGPNGERFRAATIDCLTFTPANIATADIPEVSFDINFSASDPVKYVSFEGSSSNSFSSSTLTQYAVGTGKRLNKKTKQTVSLRQSE